ncbi:caspase family protein [Myxococcota bacterium]|nr:caspase family protein [Myxococcota bacterium]
MTRLGGHRGSTTTRVAALAVLACALTSARADAAPLRRFALLVAHDDGGPDTVRLRYAEADAKKMSAILRELGGFGAEDVVTLFGRPGDEVLSGLDRLEEKIRAAKTEGAHTTLVVYYSGHGRDGALRLGRSTLPLASLRKRLTTSAADIKLGIIDACESGAITREKGGRRGPSFLVEGDDRQIGRGLVLIASSSADEASQESDELGGSFFTHYLASGLRGDADESGDRRVTLGEVYAYAYHKTVSTTASTRSGTQHPTYLYDLEGNGDLVLTDLSQGTSGLVFAAELTGDFLVFDTKREEVAAELKKVRGAARRIALPPGSYVVKKRLADHLRMKRLDLATNQYVAIDEAVMTRVEFEDDYAKGAALRARATELGLSAVFAYQSFFSTRARRELFPSTPLVGAGLDVGDVLGGTLAIELLFGGRSGLVLDLPNLAVPYDYVQIQAGAALLWGGTIGPLTLGAGPHLGGLYVRRSFPSDPVLARHPQDHFALCPGLTGRAALALGDALGVELGARLGYLPFSVDENRALFFGELGLAVSYRL